MATVGAMAATVRRELNRCTIVPLSGRASSEPTAMDSSISPRSAGVRWRRSRTCGIREAQLAKTNPEQLNATYVARTAASTSASTGGPPCLVWLTRARYTVGRGPPRGPRLAA